MAADYYRVFLASVGPTSVSVTTPAGGSWSAATYSYRVVAWYDTLETYGDYSGILNPDWDADAAAWDLNTQDTSQAHFDGVVVATNDQIALIFNKVASRDVDHYSVYYQTAATYNTDNFGIKLTHTEVDNDNGTITASVLASTANTTTASLLIVAKTQGTKTYRVNNDPRGELKAGVTFTVQGASSDTGAHTVTSVALDSTGLYTDIVVADTLDDSTADGQIDILVGGQTSFGTQSKTITMNTILDTNLTPRAVNVRAAGGGLIRKSFAFKSMYSDLTIFTSFITFSVSDYNILMRWIDQGQELILDDYSSTSDQYIVGYRGKFRPPTTHAIGGKNAQDDIGLVFDIIEQISRDGASG